MIAALYDWMKNIIIFMIFTTVIMNLLGKSNYKKYAGLVTGLILVLLVIGPILSITGNAQYLDFSLESYESLADAQDLNYELFEMEKLSDAAMMDGYYQVILKQTDGLLREKGLTVIQMNLTVEEDTWKKEFGQIQSLDIVAAYIDIREQEESLMSVDPIIINPVRLDDSSNSTSHTDKKSLSAMEIVVKNLLADFYNLDSNNINITIQEDHDGER